MTAASQKILDGIDKNGTYTTKTEEEAAAAIRLRAEGIIERIQIVGSTQSRGGKSLQLFRCT